MRVPVLGDRAVAVFPDFGVGHRRSPVGEALKGLRAVGEVAVSLKAQVVEGRLPGSWYGVR